MAASPQQVRPITTSAELYSLSPRGASLRASVDRRHSMANFRERRTSSMVAKTSRSLGRTKTLVIHDNRGHDGNCVGTVNALVTPTGRAFSMRDDGRKTTLFPSSKRNGDDGPSRIVHAHDQEITHGNAGACAHLVTPSRSEEDGMDLPSRTQDDMQHRLYQSSRDQPVTNNKAPNTSLNNSISDHTGGHRGAGGGGGDDRRGGNRDTHWNDNYSDIGCGNNSGISGGASGGASGGGGGGDGGSSGDDGDDSGSNHSGDDDSLPSTERESQDTRIMFHGREVYADDLIGLRVAKSFVGHGRFLGQVIKFDEPTTLYTVVYADGDAEELSVEETIEILIEDEIERIDPSVPPITAPTGPAFSLSPPDSPVGRNVSPGPVSTPTVSSAGSVSTTSAQVMPPAAPQVPPSSQLARRTALNMSDREVQFVTGLFENHALPTLLRRGWRVQSNAAGTGKRYFAPPGNFRGGGQVFTAALDVVELIASDNEMLSVCFPSNVHSAILSLFRDVGPPRKRSSGGSTGGNENDPKRGRIDAYERGSGSVSMVGVGGRLSGGYGGAGEPPSAMIGRGPSPHQRSDLPRSYRPDEIERQRDRIHDLELDRERIHESERHLYNSARIPTSSEHYLSSRSTRMAGMPDSRMVTRGDPSLEYRRGRLGDEHRGHPNLARQVSGDGGSAASRWAGALTAGIQSDYTRPIGHSAEWHDRSDSRGPSGQPGYPPNRAIDRNQSSQGEQYSNGLLRNPGPRSTDMRGEPRGPPNGNTDPSSHEYRYRESTGNYSPGADSFQRRYPQNKETTAEHQVPSRNIPSPHDMQERRQYGRSSSREAVSDAPPSRIPRGSAFSMSDVDRNSRPSALRGSYERGGQDRSSSPNDSRVTNPAYPSSYTRHQRSPSNDSHYSGDTTGSRAEARSGSTPNPADDAGTV